jgi:hypothetical protein
LKTKTGARDFTRDKSAPTTALSTTAALPLQSTSSQPGRRKSVTFGATETKSTTLISNRRVPPDSFFSPTLATLTPCSAFPTEAANRAKVKRKAREEELMKEEDGEEKVRLSRKRKPQEQEKHYDDCGSDVEILEESALLASRLRDNPETGCYFDVEEHRTGSAETTAHAADLVGPESYTFYGDILRDDNFMNAYDDRDFQSADLHSISVYFKYIDDLPGGNAKDVVEICGGEGGVTKLSIRRRLSTGRNFDLKHGIDLSRREDQYYLLEYIDKHKPLFVVMAPPCTPFASWSKINRHKFPEQ